MSNEEVNKIIAEYMGGPYVGDACIDPLKDNSMSTFCTPTEICERCRDIPSYYTSSLDAIVLVIRKMGKGKKDTVWGCCMLTQLIKNSKYRVADGLTIQESVARDMAKLILEQK
jgi:hypothetical protein